MLRMTIQKKEKQTTNTQAKHWKKGSSDSDAANVLGVLRLVAARLGQDDGEGGTDYFLWRVIGWGEAGVYFVYAACSQSRYDRLRDG